MTLTLLAQATTPPPGGDTVIMILTLLAAVIGGGGSTQLIGALVKGRAQRRKLGSETSLNYNIVSQTLIDQLQKDGATYRAEVERVRAEVDHLQERHEESQRSFAEQLRDAHQEHSRLTTRIAQLANDLDICMRQTEELRRRTS
ncbi:MAG: hypothetical protein ACRDRO_21685 [Pseudonocardiaceae bacterium]